MTKFVIYILIIIVIFLYIRFASSPILKKTRTVNGYEQFRDWWGRWQFTHIYVARKKVGGEIWKGHVVHHIDGNKKNNDPGNLRVMKRGKHARLHYWKRKQKKESS